MLQMSNQTEGRHRTRRWTESEEYHVLYKVWGNLISTTVVPLGVLVFCNVGIFLTLRRSRKAIRMSANKGKKTEKRSDRQIGERSLPQRRSFFSLTFIFSPAHSPHDRQQAHSSLAVNGMAAAATAKNEGVVGLARTSSSSSSVDGGGDEGEGGGGGGNGRKRGRRWRRTRAGHAQATARMGSNRSSGAGRRNVGVTRGSGRGAYKNENSLALILVGIVLVFMLCHSLRFFLAFYQVQRASVTFDLAP